MRHSRFITIRTGNPGGSRGFGARGHLPFLTPGLVLLALGLITFLAPQLILAVIAAFFLFFGGLLLFLGYKFFSFKRALDNEMKRMEEMAASGGHREEGFSQFFSSAFSSPGTHAGDPFSSHEQGASFEIDGETFEVVDADEPDVKPSSEKKEKIIIH